MLLPNDNQGLFAPNGNEGLLSPEEMARVGTASRGGSGGIGGVLDQLWRGYLQGFTTLSTGDDPDSAAEEIARSIGGVMGFLGVAVNPVGVAGRLGAGALMRSVGLASAAAKVSKAKAIVPFRSVPMMAGDAVLKRVSVFAKESARLQASSFLQRGWVKDMVGEGVRMGVAGGVSAWQGGPVEMAKAAGLGVFDGAGFSAINYKLAKALRKGGTESVAAETFLRSAINSVYAGVPLTVQGAPLPIQVYNYALGGMFGIIDRPYHERKALEFLQGKDVGDLLTVHKAPGYESLDPDVREEVDRQRNAAIGRVSLGVSEAQVIQGQAILETYEEKVTALREEGFSEEDAYRKADEFLGTALYEQVYAPMRPSQPAQGAQSASVGIGSESAPDALTGQSEALEAKPPEGLAKADGPVETGSDPERVFERRWESLYRTAMEDYDNRGSMVGASERFVRQIKRAVPSLAEADDVEVTRTVAKVFSDAWARDVGREGVAETERWQSAVGEFSKRWGVEDLPAWADEIDAATPEGARQREAVRMLRKAWKVYHATEASEPGYFKLKPGGYGIETYRGTDSMLQGTTRFEAPSHMATALYRTGADGERTPVKVVQVERVEDTIKPQSIHEADLPLGAYFKAAFEQGRPPLFGQKAKDRFAHTDGWLYDVSDAERLVSDKQAAIAKAIAESGRDDQVPVSEAYDALKADFRRAVEGEFPGGQVTGAEADDMFDRFWMNDIIALEQLNGGVPFEDMVRESLRGEADFILDPTKLNKRGQLFGDTNLKANIEAFPERVREQGALKAAVVRAGGTFTERGDGRLQVMMDRLVKGDKGYTKDVEAFVAEHHLDGVTFVVPDAFSGFIRDAGLDPEAGVFKASTVFATEKEGAFLGKQAVFVAPERMAAEMQARGLDVLFFDTAAKQTGRRKAYDMRVAADGAVKFYNRGQGGNAGRQPVTTGLKAFDVPVDAFRVNVGVEESPKKALADQRGVRQYGTVLEGEAQDAYLEGVVLPEIRGDEVANKAYWRWRQTGDDSHLDGVHVDDLGFEEVLDLLIDPDSHTQQATTGYARLREQMDESAADVDLEGADMVDGGDDLVGVLDRVQRYTSGADRAHKLFPRTPASDNWEPLKGLVDAKVRGYLMRRVLRPRLPYSGKAVAYPNDPHLRLGKNMTGDDRITDDVEPGYVYFGEALRAKKIRWIKGDEVTLGEAFDEFKAAREKGENTSEMERYLTFHTVRVPVDSASGVRPLLFGGFTGRKGAGGVVHNEEMIAMGGMDLDIDSFFWAQNPDLTLNARGVPGSPLTDFFTSKKDQRIEPGMARDAKTKKGRPYRVVKEQKISDDVFVEPLAAHEKHPVAVAAPHVLMQASKGAYVGNKMLGVPANIGRRGMAWYEAAGRGQAEAVRVEMTGNKNKVFSRWGVAAGKKDTVEITLTPTDNTERADFLRGEAMNYAADSGDVKALKVDSTSIGDVVTKEYVKSATVVVRGPDGAVKGRKTLKGGYLKELLTGRDRATGERLTYDTAQKGRDGEWRPAKGEFYGAGPTKTAYWRNLVAADRLADGNEYTRSGEKRSVGLWKTLLGLSDATRATADADGGAAYNVHYKALAEVGRVVDNFREGTKGGIDSRVNGVAYVDFPGFKKLWGKVEEVFNADTDEAKMLRAATGRQSLYFGEANKQAETVEAWKLKQDVADLASVAFVTDAYKRAASKGVSKQVMQEVADRVSALHRSAEAMWSKRMKADGWKVEDRMAQQAEMEKVDARWQEAHDRVKALRDGLTQPSRDYLDAYVLSSLTRQPRTYRETMERVEKRGRELGWDQRQIDEAKAEARSRYHQTSFQVTNVAFDWIDPAAVQRFGKHLNDAVQATQRPVTEHAAKVLLGMAKGESPVLERAQKGAKNLHGARKHRAEADRFAGEGIRKLVEAARGHAGEVFTDDAAGRRATRAKERLKAHLKHSPNLRRFYEEMFAGLTSDMRLLRGGIGTRTEDAVLKEVEEFLDFLDDVRSGGGGPIDGLYEGGGKYRGKPVPKAFYFLYPERIARMTAGDMPLIEKDLRRVYEMAEMADGTMQRKTRLKEVRVFSSTFGAIRKTMAMANEAKNAVTSQYEKGLAERFRFLRERLRQTDYDASDVIAAVVARSELDAAKAAGYSGAEIARYREEYEPHAALYDKLKAEGRRFPKQQGEDVYYQKGTDLITDVREAIRQRTNEDFNRLVRDKGAERAWFITRDGRPFDPENPAPLDVGYTLRRIHRAVQTQGEMPMLGVDGVRRLVYEMRLPEQGVWIGQDGAISMERPDEGNLYWKPLKELQGTEAIEAEQLIRTERPFLVTGNVTQAGGFYWPHRDHSESAKTKAVEARLEKLQREGASPDELAREAATLNRAFEMGQLTDGEWANDGVLDMLFDGTLGRDMKASQIDNAGIFRVPGATMARGQGLPGWSKSLSALEGYEKSLIAGHYSMLGSLMSKRLLDSFVEKNTMGETTESWARFMRLYVRDAIGGPSLFPQEYLNDEALNLTNKPYYWLTDQHFAEKLDRIEARYGLKKKRPGYDGDKAVARRLDQIAQLDGKWNFFTLLARFKQFTYNGSQVINTVVNVGFDPVRRAFSLKHVLALNPHDAEANPTGWKGWDDVRRWAEGHGAVESFIFEDAAMPKELRTAEVAAFMKDARGLIKAAWRKGEDVSDATLKDLWTKKYGLSDKMWKVAAWPMRQSERWLRLNAFLAHYMHFRDVLGYNRSTFDVNDPWLIELSRRGVKTTQFLYDNACVDEDTEILTAAGWKRWDEVEQGEAVFSTDPDGRLVEDRVKAVHVYQRPTPVRRYSNSRFEMVVTDNHRCVVQNYNSRDKKYQRPLVREAKDLRIGHHLLRRPLGEDLGRKAVWSDDFVALLGWVSSEGTYGRFTNCKARSRVSFVQSKAHNPEYVAEIDEMMGRLQHHSRHEYDYMDSVQWVLNGGLRKRVLKAMPDKKPTWAMLSVLTPDQMRLLVMTFAKGDGTCVGKGWVITQKDRQTLEVLQAMATMAGMTTYLREVPGEGVHRLTVTDGSARSQVGGLEVERRVEPMVWCVETGQGTWIARKAGRVFVTGNSKPAFMRTSLGKVLTRFKTWTFSSVGFQAEVYKKAQQMGFQRGSPEQARFERMMVANLFALALASLFPASMFEATLPQPMGWLKDLSEFFFGSDEDREDAFFGDLPYPFNVANTVLPPSARIVTTWIPPLVSGEWDRWAEYQAWTMPFAPGLGIRDIKKTIENPLMGVQYMTGIPLIGLQRAAQQARRENEGG